MAAAFLSDPDWDAIKAMVRDVARRVILPRFRALDTAEVTAKTHAADLVTIADIEAEAELTAELQARWPGVTVIGEEAVSRGEADVAAIAGAETCVILDPVDGTWNFAMGLATFGVIVAVVEHGQTTRGLLYDPTFDDVIEATAGQGAWRGMAGAPARRLQPTVDPNLPLAGFLALGLLPEAKRGDVVSALAPMSKFHTLRCSCFEYRMLATGDADFCLSGDRPNPWDHAAGALAVRESGGVARRLDGADYRADMTDGYILTARTLDIWEWVAERLRPIL